MRRSFFRFLICSFAVAVMAVAGTVRASAREFVVVIDPGHGGKDHGAVGRKAKEKDIVLAVGKAFGRKIKDAYGRNDEVKVVYTRDDDTFVTLQGRADIANKAKGDLFVSIHANSVDKRTRGRDKIHGASVYTLGVNRAARNLEVAQRENAVMVLEPDYTTTYAGFDPNSAESYIIFEMEQNRHMVQSLNFAAKAQRELVKTAGRGDKNVRQAGFWVLHATSMPSVLVELDFICNPTQETYMSSKKGQDKLAQALFNAFVAYKKAYDAGEGGMQDQQETEGDAGKEQEEDEGDDTPDGYQESLDGGLRYCVQFLTSGKPLSEGASAFKGLRPVYSYRDAGLYKYYYGSYGSMDDALDALKKVKRSFKDAFVIKMRDGKRVK